MNYWEILKRALAALAAGDFRGAEVFFHRAHSSREESPRRRFASEAVPDGARRIWRILQRRPQVAGEPEKRWARADREFRIRFRSLAAESVDQATRLAERRPEDDAEANQPRLESAVFLTTVSRLNPADPSRAVILLRALFRTAVASGRSFAADLIRADLPLAAEDRLWLARQGQAILASARAEGDDPTGTAAADWTRSLLGLLAAPLFDGDERAEEDKRWLAARLADDHLDDPEEILVHLHGYLALLHRPRDRADQVRLRAVQVLGNLDRPRLVVPRYDEALALAAQEEPEPASEAAVRLAEARAVIAYRRSPERPSRAWISAGGGPDGRFHFVFWWEEAPTDTASWAPGEDTEALAAFLAPAEGRMLWSGEQIPADVADGFGKAEIGRVLSPLVAVLLEPWLPPGGLTDEQAERLGLAHTAAWRETWHPRRGHPLLTPPGADGQLAEPQAALTVVLRTGLLWLACRHRIESADPALRGGLGEMGRRGCGLAAFLHDAAVLGSAARAAVDAGFEAWTLPVLWGRPDPLGTGGGGEIDGDGFERRDLAGNDVTVVTTGRPEQALAAWGDGSRRWRIVLDRSDRLGSLRHVAARAFGPVTIVPAAGRVHDLDAALRRLEELVAGPDEPLDALLAVFHWIRLVETHNGDLLDFQRLRRRAAGEYVLGDRYAEIVADLPAVRPRITDDPGEHGWGAQYCQRVRKSGLVAGLVQDLTDSTSALDDLWGVFDGSEASWVFLDAAAVHWGLATRGDRGVADLHSHLASRGRRHLSIVTAGGFFPDDLSAILDELLVPYGRPYHVGFGDARPPQLRLVSQGPLPGARILAVEGWAAPLAHVDAEGDSVLSVLVPDDAEAREFWQWAGDRSRGTSSWTLVSGDPLPAPRAAPVPAARLVVPVLRSLGPLTSRTDQDRSLADGDPPERWREADSARRDRVRHRRRRAALEVNALLAVDYAAVEILDGRWWRTLLPVGSELEAAAAELGLASADFFPLSTDPVRAGSRARLGEVREWLARRSPPAVAPSFVTEEASADAGAAGPRVRLHSAVDHRPWQRLARRLLRDWEAGRPGQRLVVLADSPPQGAAAVVNLLDTAGLTVPATDAPRGVAEPLELEEPGPLVWIRPDDLARIPRDQLAALRPTAVLALDVAAWLPTAVARRDETARALGWLARCGADHVELVTGPVGPSWGRFMRDILDADADLRLPAAHGGWPVLERGEALRLHWRCLHCDASGEARGESVCRRCGTALANPGPGPAAEKLGTVDAVQRFLLRRRDLGRDRPLDIWCADLENLDLKEQGVEASRADPDESGDPPAWHLADGRVWATRRPTNAAVARDEAETLIVGVPTDPLAVRPFAPASDSATAFLLYDDAELGDRMALDPTSGGRRLMRLMREESVVTADEDRPAAAAGLAGDVAVPVFRLARLAGITVPQARETIHQLVWAARACGAIPPAARPVAPSAPWLWIRHPYAGIEYVLRQLREDLAVFLEHSLLGAIAGSTVEVEAPLPAGETDDDRERARRLDALLCLGTALVDPPARGRLHYWPVRGAWCGGGRWLGWTGEREAALVALGEALDRFAAWVREVMVSAVPDPAGLILRPDALAPADWPRDWLVWGDELDLWQVWGLEGPEFTARADLIRLRESPALQPGSAVVALVEGLNDERARWGARLASTPPESRLSPLRARRTSAARNTVASGPVSLLRRRDRREAGDAVADKVRRVALAQPPGFLVLDGTCGTHRHTALLRGLRAALDHADRPDAVTVWCPDAATAARLAVAALGLQPSWSLDVRIPGPGNDPELVPPASGERSVNVLAEAQRFDRDLRYRLQDTGRLGNLIMTVDAVETGVPWEDLFLASPRRDRVVKLEEQQLQARRLAEETALLRRNPAGRSRSRRRERGTLTSRCAGNLDECVSAVLGEFGVRPPGGGVDLTAPLPEDAAYLGRALEARGWIAVARVDVDSLLLPGARELTALLVDLAEAEIRRGARDAEMLDRASVLARLVPPPYATAVRRWLGQLAGVRPVDVAEAWEQLARSPWGRETCGRQAAFRRAVALATRHAALAPVAFAARPEVLGWRQRLASGSSFADLSLDRPVVRLAGAEVPTGAPGDAGVYVCFGSEPISVHARILGRIASHALVLYQEHSPLPSEAGETSG